MFTRGKPKEESFFLIFREQKKRDYNLLVPEIKNVLNGKKNLKRIHESNF